MANLPVDSIRGQPAPRPRKHPILPRPENRTLVQMVGQPVADDLARPLRIAAAREVILNLGVNRLC